MTADVRVALDQLTAAFERHLAAVQARRDEDDPAVETAYLQLGEAFETYDNVLLDELDETTPLVLFDEDEFDEDSDDLDDGEEIDEMFDYADDEDTEYIDLGSVDASASSAVNTAEPGSTSKA